MSVNSYPLWSQNSSQEKNIESTNVPTHSIPSTESSKLGQLSEKLGVVELQSMSRDSDTASQSSQKQQLVRETIKQRLIELIRGQGLEEELEQKMNTINGNIYDWMASQLLDQMNDQLSNQKLNSYIDNLNNRIDLSNQRMDKKMKVLNQNPRNQMVQEYRISNHDNTTTTSLQGSTSSQRREEFVANFEKEPSTEEQIRKYGQRLPWDGNPQPKQITTQTNDKFTIEGPQPTAGGKTWKRQKWKERVEEMKNPTISQDCEIERRYEQLKKELKLVGSTSNQRIWRRVNTASDFPKSFYMKQKYTGEQGPRLPKQFQLSPYNLFKLFFDNEIYDLIIDNTKKKYQREKEQQIKRGETTHNVFEHFEVNRFILDGYFAVLVILGTKKLPAQGDLWSKSDYFQNESANKLMVQAHFQGLNRFLCLSDMTKKEVKEDPIGRVRKYIDLLNEKYAKYYYPSQFLTIDQGMIPFHGRVSFKIFNPLQPNRWGMKEFVLCDGSNGYTLETRVFYHQDQENGEMYTTRTNELVASLLFRYENQNHQVAMDNYYTSPAVFAELKQRKIGAVGTIRPTRIKLQVDQWAQVMDVHKGKVVSYIQSDQNCVVFFKGTGDQECALLSNFMDCTLVRDKFWQTRFFVKNSDHNLKKHMTFMREVYNRYKGGVDYRNGLLAKFRTRRHSVAWWVPIFHRMFDNAIANAYILFRMMNSDHQISQKDFRYILAKELAKRYQVFKGAVRQEKRDKVKNTRSQFGQYLIEQMKLCKLNNRRIMPSQLVVVDTYEDEGDLKMCDGDVEDEVSILSSKFEVKQKHEFKERPSRIKKEIKIQQINSDSDSDCELIDEIKKEVQQTFLEIYSSSSSEEENNVTVIEDEPQEENQVFEMPKPKPQINQPVKEKVVVNIEQEDKKNQIDDDDQDDDIEGSDCGIREFFEENANLPDLDSSNEDIMENEDYDEEKDIFGQFESVMDLQSAVKQCRENFKPMFDQASMSEIEPNCDNSFFSYKSGGQYDIFFGDNTKETRKKNRFFDYEDQSFTPFNDERKPTHIVNKKNKSVSQSQKSNIEVVDQNDEFQFEIQ